MNHHNEKPETARLRKKELPLMSQEDIDCITNAERQVGDILAALKEKKGFSGKDVVDIFSEYIADEQTLSRYINHGNKRRISAALLFALRRMFGISIDAIVDGTNQPKSDLPPELRRALLEWLSNGK